MISMRIYLISILSFFLIQVAFSKEQEKGWGLSLGEGTSNLRVGGRLQGIYDYRSSNGAVDLYLRRARVNLQYQLEKFHLIYVDLRNDNSNKGDGGERSLLIGDAFYEVPLDVSFVDNLTLFRAKVDVSYSQTASSKDLMHPNRESISDHASNFIVHNRRATNIQLNGSNDWMEYQVVLADGIQSDQVDEVYGGVTVNGISDQSLTYGGKVRFFLWGDRTDIKETFYGAKNTFSLGLGYFNNRSVTYELSNDQKLTDSRQLYNAELSFSYMTFRVLAEAFIFEGDAINLEERRLGKSQGGYIRAEYIMGNTAPYIGIQSFQRDSDSDDSFENTQLVGINYYAAKKSRRYGISFKNYDLAKSLGSPNREEIMTYMLIDY
jgi:hypothetical protein